MAITSFNGDYRGLGQGFYTNNIYGAGMYLSSCCINTAHTIGELENFNNDHPIPVVGIEEMKRRVTKCSRLLWAK